MPENVQKLIFEKKKKFLSVPMTLLFQVFFSDHPCFLIAGKHEILLEKLSLAYLEKARALDRKTGISTNDSIRRSHFHRSFVPLVIAVRDKSFAWVPRIKEIRSYRYFQPC